MKSPTSNQPKTPEQLAQELEERLVQDAIRARRWRQRREIYRIVTLLIGMLFPSFWLTLVASLSNDSFSNWIANFGWLPLAMTAGGGLAAAAVAFSAGWGVSRCMMMYGALFALLVVVNQARLGTVISVMPILVCVFVAAGGLVGFVVTLEDDS